MTIKSYRIDNILGVPGKMPEPNRMPAKLYGCNNKPRPTSLTTIPAQDGWVYDHHVSTWGGSSGQTVR